MRYFVESVSTLSTTGKSRKGAVLQAVVRRFEHTILADDDALIKLVSRLQAVVNAVNTLYKGKKVSLNHHADSGHIWAHSGYTGNEAYIFSLSYVPVGETMYQSNIHTTISDMLYNMDNVLMVAYAKGGEA